jgi:hypothetical protein
MRGYAIVAQIVAASIFQEHRWKMTGSAMNMKLAAQCSRGCRPAVGPSTRAPPPMVMAGAVASPGKQMLLVRRHPPGPGRRHLPSLGWTSTSRAAGVVVASATATTDTSSSRQPKEEDRASRNISGFQPSIWGDFFLTYSSPLAAQKVCNNL